MGPVPSPLGHALTGLVDYAGLFPPAALPMAEAVRNYAEYLRGPQSWMLGRFVVSGARLGEFVETLAAGPPQALGAPLWPLTVVLGADPAADLARLKQAAEGPVGEWMSARTVEAVAIDAVHVRELRRQVPSRIRLYVEIPPGPEMARIASVVRQAGAWAKIRMGSTRQGEIPPPESVLAFLTATARLGLPFKATAGLHHPLRRPAPLTYAPESPIDTMYGFLNLTLAAAAVWHGRGDEIARSLLLEEDAGSLMMDPLRLSLGGHQFSGSELAIVRQQFFQSIGSCSFEEPVEELEALGADLGQAERNV